MNEQDLRTSPRNLRRAVFKASCGLLALLPLLFGGCFQIDELVRLKPDGSGTVEQTVTMTAEGMTQFSQMPAVSSLFGSGNAVGGAGATGSSFKLPDEAKLNEMAGKMGARVTFVSVKEVKTATSQGYTSVFAFADVNDLKISADPTGGGGGRRHTRDAANKPENVALAFTKGPPAELHVTLPQTLDASPKKPKSQAADSAFGEAMLPMLMQVLKDMHVSVSVEPQGTIVGTNSQYRNGSRITVLDVDFNKLLADPAKLNELVKMGGQTSPDAIEILKSVPGIEFETASPLIIRFQ